jgi:hypothetical protein
MRVKIIKSTNRSYVGKILEVEALSDIDGLLTGKDTLFRVINKVVRDNIITLSCPNYIVKLKILDM